MGPALITKAEEEELEHEEHEVLIRDTSPSSIKDAESKGLSYATYLIVKADDHLFKELILKDQGLLLNCDNPNESTLLMIATHQACIAVSRDIESSREMIILEFILYKLREFSLMDEIDRVNSVGSSAIMIAAELGCTYVVKLLHENGANVYLKQDKYENTALILACERNHVDVVKYLMEFDPELLYYKNKYGKTVLSVAMEKGSLDVAKWFLFQYGGIVDVNERSIKGISLLMYACFNSEAHHEILDALLDKGADPLLGPMGAYYTNSLMWASIRGSTHAVRRLLLNSEMRECINRYSGEFSHGCRTALMMACAEGHYDMAKILKDNGASLWMVRPAKYGRLEFLYDDESLLKWHDDENVHSSIKRTAFHMALERGHVRVTELFIRDSSVSLNDPNFYSEQDGLSYSLDLQDPNKIYSSQTLDKLADVYLRPECMMELIDVAGKCSFHFNLLIVLFQRLRSIRFLLDEGIFRLLQNIHKSRITRHNSFDDADLVYKLTQLLHQLYLSKAAQPVELQGINEWQGIVDKVVDNTFNSFELRHDKSRSLMMTYLNDIDSINWTHYNGEAISDERVRFALALFKGPLALSLRMEASSLSKFARVDDVFWDYLRLDAPRSRYIEFFRRYLCLDFNCILKWAADTNSGRLHSDLIHALEWAADTNFGRLHSDLIHARYNPSIMFFAEGVCKLSVLVLVTGIIYRLKNDTTWIDLRLWRGALALTTLSHLLHEYGEMCSTEFSMIPSIRQVVHYFDNIWNYCDAIGYTCLLIWTCGYFINENESYVAECAISTSGIFLCTGLLRYVTVVESLGQFTIILIEMIKDLTWFIFMFLIILFGFAVSLYGLLHGQKFCDLDEDIAESECAPDPYFRTPWKTFLTLFSATLGNFDLEIYLNRGPYNGVGNAVILIFLIVFGIVLLSLIVARMSATYEAVEKSAFQRWQFSKAKFVESFLLIHERNVFCLLPPPLNLIPLVASFSVVATKSYVTGVGMYDEQYSVTTLLSVGGTVADKVMGIIMSFFAPFVELIRILLESIKIVDRKLYKAISVKNLCRFFNVSILFIIFPVMYPFYAFHLILKSLSLYTLIDQIEQEHRGRKMEYMVSWPREQVYKEIHVQSKDKDAHIEARFLNIKNTFLYFRRMSCKFVASSTSDPTLNFSVTSTFDTNVVEDFNGLVLVCKDAYIRIPLIRLFDDVHSFVRMELILYDDRGEEFATKDVTSVIKVVVLNFRFEGRMEFSSTLVGDSNVEMNVVMYTRNIERLRGTDHAMFNIWSNGQKERVKSGSDFDHLDRRATCSTTPDVKELLSSQQIMKQILRPVCYSTRASSSVKFSQKSLEMIFEPLKSKEKLLTEPDTHDSVTA